MRLIRKKEIKFIKLCLISPWLEQAVNFLYLISLPVLIFIFLANSKTFNANEIDSLTRVKFKENDLRMVSNKTDFIEYLDDVLDSLYNPTNVPFFVPIGSVRLRKYSIKKNCDLCYYSRFGGKFVFKNS
jgi:hypothetical protein